MAPGDYYPSYYGQPTQQQPQQQAYPNYPTQSGQAANAQYQHSRAQSGGNAYQNYPQQQSYEQGSTFAKSSNWYGLNSNDSSLGRAAETLSNLGNTIQSKQAAVSSPAVAPQYQTSTYPSAAYATSSPQIARAYPATTSAYTVNSAGGYSYATTQHGHNATNTQPQRQPRPDSVNSMRSAARSTLQSPTTNGFPQQTPTYSSQRVHNASAIQRSASPAQIQAAHNLTASAHRATNTATYGNPVSRNTPNVSQDQRRTSSTQQPQQPVSQSSVGQEDSQSITVDPSQVYDPWPEYQRRKAAEEAQRARKQADEAERRKAMEEAKRRRDEEALRQEEQRRAEEEAAAEVARRAEESVNEPQPQANKKQRQPKKDKPPKLPKDPKQPKEAKGKNKKSAANAQTDGAVDDEDDDVKMLAMLKAMRAKNPELLRQFLDQADGDGGKTQDSQAQASPVALPAASPSINAQNSGPKPKSKAASQPTPAKGNVIPVSESALKAKEAAARAARDAQAVSIRNDTIARSSQTSAHGTAPTPPQPKPAQAADKPTIWPPEKKNSLAQAASAFLNNAPENKDRQLSPGDIIQLLDTNPSYITLCEQLEATGLKIDRAAFARSLLTAVPDVNAAARRQREEKEKQAQQKKVPAPVQTNRNNAPSAAPPSAPTSAATPTLPESRTSQVQRYVNGSWQQANASSPGQCQSPYFGQDGQALPVQPLSKPPTPAPVAQMVKPMARSASPNKPPASKEEAARKRTFGDIVDLTALSDDEPEPEPKRPYFGTPPVPAMGYGPNGPPPYRGPPLPNFAGYQYQGNSYPATIGYQILPPNFPYPHVLVPPPLHQHAGPATQQPLLPPQHLQAVQSLSEKLKGVTLVEQIERHKALRRSLYDVKSIARDVLLATGRHPDMFHLNAHLEVLKTHLPQVGDKSDLATLRWDLLDPGEPLPLPQMENDGADSVIAAEDADADDEEDEGPEQLQTRTLVRRTVGGGDDHKMKPANHSSAHPEGLRRRGRPARKSYPSFSTRNMDGTAERSADAGGYSSPAPSKQTSTQTPSSAPNMPPTGYSAFRSTQNADGTRKRGRPVGWRKAIHGRPEIAEAARSRAAEQAGKKKRDVPSPEPQYQVYHCKWKDCNAELHNLKTLRAHVAKAHQKQSAHGGFTCRWDSCGKEISSINRQTGEKEPKRQRLDFSTEPEFSSHLEKSHFNRLAWTLGDGPASGLSGEL